MRINMFNKNNAQKNDENVSGKINIISHFDSDTLQDKSGKLIKIIKLDGIDAIGKDDQALDIYKNRRNNLLKNFSSEFAFYFWEIRRKINTYPAGDFDNYFAESLNAKYKSQIHSSDMFQTELYMGIMTKPQEGLINKIFQFIKNISLTIDKEAKKLYLKQSHQKLNDATNKVLSILSEYSPKVLGTYYKEEKIFSAPLEFLTILINFDQHKIPLKIEAADKALPKKRIFFNDRSGVIELRSVDGMTKIASVLSIKAYSPHTYQGILDELSTLKCEYVLTQSFRPYDRQVAKNKQREQQKEMLQTNDVSFSQTEEISDAFDETASGEVGYGIHHLSLVCYADTQEKLQQDISLINAKFSDQDITCVKEDVACEPTFWAQLPGNFSYILREADISTKNMAGFSSLHNCPKGQIDGNYWGNAVTVFETISGNPYYFNFHYKDVGNFLVFGSMGSGKTLLIGFLIAQSMKFGGKRIIFDKDRGLEILVRALDGNYEIIKTGTKTGFNPCQLSDTPENRNFLSVLFRKLLTVNGEQLNESETNLIEKVIDGMYRLEPIYRQFSHIASFFGSKKSSTLRARFDQWHSDGAYAWLFDNETDTLNLDHDVLGFELGSILSDEVCKTPALMYLTYRVEKVLEGQRGLLFIDEGWLALTDDYFLKLIQDWSRTPRKKNNIFGLATQTTNDTARSLINKPINEAAACKFFFSNPSADKDIYINELGLTEHEYQIVKTLPDDLHYFLLVYGRGVNKQVVIARLNLTKMEDEIAVISGREATVSLLDTIRKTLGNCARAWLGAFHKMRKML